MAEQPCPCGSGLSLGVCCGPYLDGGAEAPTAEALMRSRFTAYVRRDGDYIARSWHSATRPADASLGSGVEWERLEVLASEEGGLKHQRGWVEFVAEGRVDGRPQRLHEVSRFEREAGCWRYLDGETPDDARPPSAPRRTSKPGRNRPCPCGSGKKYKRCCGRVR